MFHRIENGWRLAQQSWRVLRLDTELLLFPLMSGICCLLVMATFALPLWGGGYLSVFLDEGDPAQRANEIDQLIGYLLLFGFYFANYFVIVFFNSALMSCAIIRFKGGNPTLADGFSAAMSRLPQIAGWALVAATVGMILRLIESRSERAGEFVASLLGMAWSAVTYFVVPVIVVERTGPVRAVQRSLEVLKRTWGEALTVNFGIGFVVFLANLVAAIPLVLGVFALAAGMTPVGVALCTFGVVAVITVSLVSSALQSIAVGALYLYAAEGTIPEQFDDDAFRRAFVHR